MFSVFFVACGGGGGGGNDQTQDPNLVIQGAGGGSNTQLASNDPSVNTNTGGGISSPVLTGGGGSAPGTGGGTAPPGTVVSIDPLEGMPVIYLTTGYDSMTSSPVATDLTLYVKVPFGTVFPSLVVADIPGTGGVFSLTFKVTSPPTCGKLFEVSNQGSVYRGNPNCTTDSFKYQLEDTLAGVISNEATVNVTINHEAQTTTDCPVQGCAFGVGDPGESWINLAARLGETVTVWHTLVRDKKTHEVIDDLLGVAVYQTPKVVMTNPNSHPEMLSPGVCMKLEPSSFSFGKEDSEVIKTPVSTCYDEHFEYITMLE